MLPQLWRRFYFYPRSPCGERRSCCTAHQISAQFLSTLSLRRATTQTRHCTARRTISIHALLAESDGLPVRAAKLVQAFLSTLSLRRATFLRRRGWYRNSNFYPRSPCGERRRRNLKEVRCMDFYPRSPCGERRALAVLPPSNGYFYPRSPCGERRCWRPEYRTRPGNFYPRSPCGERHYKSALTSI